MLSVRDEDIRLKSRMTVFFLTRVLQVLSPWKELRAELWTVLNSQMSGLQSGALGRELLTGYCISSQKPAESTM